MGVAVGFLAYNGYKVIEWILQVGDFPAFSWAAVLVWAPVWAYHWWIESNESADSIPLTRGISRLYLYLASALGIAMLASGVGFLVYFILNEGYSAAFAVDLTGSERLLGDAARTALSVSLVGGLIWWTHWFRFASDDRSSILRWIYLFVATIGAGRSRPSWALESRSTHRCRGSWGPRANRRRTTSKIFPLESQLQPSESHCGCITDAG